MDLPSDVPIPTQAVVDEMSLRISSLMMANIRLTCMIHELVKQRNDALKRWEQEKNKNAVGDRLVHKE